MVKVLAVSGYKPFELGIFQKDHIAASYITKAIKKNLEAMLDDELEWVLISGQLGVELWAAEAVFELQLEHPDLKLAVITPFLDQEVKWNEKNQEWYESILARADYIASVTNKGYEKPWQFRLKNQFFLEKSDGLLLVYDPEKEGSPKYLYELALEYQKTKAYSVQLLTFYDLQSVVEEDQDDFLL